MTTPIKQAGAMLAHLELFHHMLHVRSLLQLAQHMEERGDRVTMVSPESITLIGAGQESAPSVQTGKGATIGADSAYTVLRGLKGHDAPEYAVTREELKALNARAVADIEGGDAMRAFSETIARVTADGQGAPAPAVGQPAAAQQPAQPTVQPTTPQERGLRGRRGAEGEATATAEN